MASIKFDFSKNAKLGKSKNQVDNTSHYKYRDINTKDIVLSKDHITDVETIHSSGSNFDKDAVKEALHNILTFRNGEDILDPDFGIGEIYQMLYTPFDKHTTEKMLKTIREIIRKYEPRINVISIPTEYSEDTNTFSMTIFYEIPELGVSDSYQLILMQ